MIILAAQQGRSAEAVRLEDEFDATSSRYDLMVSLNPGYHDHLRAAAQELALHLPTDRAPRLLDLGCGSGASTKALVGEVRDDAEVVGVDASDGMLDSARRKSWPAGVRFVHGPAEDVAAKAEQWELPTPVDGVIAAYLFRNVTDRDATLRAVHDVLAPGGRLVVQEYSVAASWRAKAIWTFVCWSVVIPLSLVVTRRTALYRYLWRSVLRMDTVPRFEGRLRAAGFDDVHVTTVGGWQKDVLHTISARRRP